MKTGSLALVAAALAFSVSLMAWAQGDNGTVTDIRQEGTLNPAESAAAAPPAARPSTTTTTTTSTSSTTSMKAPEGTGAEKNLLKTGDVGLGFGLGTPNEFTVKFWTAEDRAVDINAAFQSNDLAIIADHLWHFRTVFRSSDGKVSPVAPYIGIGAEGVFHTGNSQTTSDNIFRQTNDNGTEVGARIPIGIEYLPRFVSIGVFAELAPGVVFTPDNFTFIQGGVGARYYF